MKMIMRLVAEQCCQLQHQPHWMRWECTCPGVLTSWVKWWLDLPEPRCRVLPAITWQHRRFLSFLPFCYAGRWTIAMTNPSVRLSVWPSVHHTCQNGMGWLKSTNLEFSRCYILVTWNYRVMRLSSSEDHMIVTSVSHFVPVRDRQTDGRTEGRTFRLQLVQRSA